MSSEEEGPGAEPVPAGTSGAPDEPSPPPTAVSAITEPTPQELAGLTVMERLELLHRERQFHLDERERHRAHRHQWINTVAIVLGVIVGVATVAITIPTLRATEDQIRIAREDIGIAKEAQVTDRYAKTIETLSDDDASVRLGAIHALGRLMIDSPRDRAAITAILIAYLNQRPAKNDKKQKVLSGSDLEAAITTLGNRPDPRPLPSLNLRDFDMTGIRLPKGHLVSANLGRANVSGANLRGANLVSADLRYANLRHAYVSGADLRRADLRSADLGGADLGGANLSGADLSGADLSGADLLVADLRYADLSGAKLPDAKLSGTKLRGANLRGADLSGADLSNATLGGANLRGAKLPGANLENADLRNADLSGADLRGANPSGVNPSGAKLGGADLRGTGLTRELLETAGRAEVDGTTLFGPLPKP